MFNNLIESCTHKNELKRKSSFFFATIAVYALLLSAAGIASVVAYEAHLENQSLEVYALLTPVQQTKQEEPPERQQPPRSSSNRQQVATRTVLIDRVANPTNPPDQISTTPSNVPEIPERGRVVIGSTNTDPDMPTGPVNNSNSSSTNQGTNPVVPDTETPPSAPKTEPKPPKVISKGVVNGIALSLPKPSYPQIAKAAGVRGQVSVQVLIDETGKVVSASVISGHPLLRNEAVRAALQARFNPTRLSDVPVKVSGVINYNFTF